MIDASRPTRTTLSLPVIDRALRAVPPLAPRPAGPLTLRERTIRRAVLAGLLRPALG